MSNRYAEREVVEIINPSSSPFLHIQKVPDEKGNPQYVYLPSLEGLQIAVGILPRLQIDQFQQQASLKLPLLPPLPASVDLSHLPPTIYGRQLVQDVILSNQLPLLKTIQPNATALLCTHGSMWGQYPEDVIREILQSQGYKVQGGSFPEIGGRKRIVTHAILLLDHPAIEI